MNILGIDYGLKKVGLAVGDMDSKLAIPLGVARFNYVKELMEKVEQAVQVEQVDKVVLGVSEGEIGKSSREFGRKLEEKLGIEVVFQDEVMTTQDAQKLSQEAGMKRVKRKGMEDAFAATLILQSFFDSVI